MPNHLMLTKECAAGRCADCPVEDSYSLGNADWPIGVFDCDHACHYEMGMVQNPTITIEFTTPDGVRHHVTHQCDGRCLTSHNP